MSVLLSPLSPAVPVYTIFGALSSTKMDRLMDFSAPVSSIEKPHVLAGVPGRRHEIVIDFFTSFHLPIGRV